MYSSPVRHSPPIRASSYCAAVRLACVRPAASVHSEPGSNSSLKITCPKTNYFSCRSSTTDNLSLAKQLICCFLIKRLQDGQSSFLQASAQITCAHCQRTWGVASAPFPSASSFPSKRAAHYSGLFLAVNTLHSHLVDAALFTTRSLSAYRAGHTSRLCISVNPAKRLLTLLHFSPPTLLSVHLTFMRFVNIL